MGMFDWVKFETQCPVCGSKVAGFQSKRADCNLDCLEFWQVDNFYSSCDNCNTWIELSLKEETRKKFTIIELSLKEETRKKFTIDDYEMKIRKR